MNTNLLDGPVGTGMRSRLYPGILRAVATAVFALIMFQLLLGPEAAHDNFGSALTWVLWWPLLPLALFLAGRAWCAVCPFGWLSDAVQRLVGLERRVPVFLKRYGIWLIDATFIGITWADHVFGIVSSPWGSGLLLLLMTTAVVVSGALWQRRAFCRYVCFLGGVQGNYARAGVVGLRADTSICETCDTRAVCFNGGEAAASCPLFEFPRTMDSSANCNLCAHCIKNCPHDAISVTVRPPASELWFIRTPKLAEAFLAAAIMGIVLVQNVAMLGVWNDILGTLERLSGTDAYGVNYTLAFIAAISLPLAALGVAAGLSARVGGHDWLGTFAIFGYALIPLDLAAHLAHNLFHLLAEGKSILYTGLALLGGSHEHGSAALVSDSAIQLMQFMLIAGGLGLSAYTALRLSETHERSVAAIVPVWVLLGGFAVLNVLLFTLPMSMRM